MEDSRRMCRWVVPTETHVIRYRWMISAETSLMLCVVGHPASNFLRPRKLSPNDLVIQKMIARHGHLSLSKDREVVLSPHHASLDEGIVTSIVDGVLCARVNGPHESTPQSLVETLLPSTRTRTGLISIFSPSLKTDSIGVVIGAVHGFLECGKYTKKMTIVWEDRFKQQVIYITFEHEKYPNIKPGCSIVLTKRGILVFPNDGDRRCYMLKTTDTPNIIREICYGKFPTDKMFIYEEDAFCKNLDVSRDITIICHE